MLAGEDGYHIYFVFVYIVEYTGYDVIVPDIGVVGIKGFQVVFQQVFIAFLPG
jgi:hypothetical protein